MLRFLTAGESHGPPSPQFSMACLLDFQSTPPSLTLNWLAVKKAMDQADA